MEISPLQAGISGVLGEWNINIEVLMENFKQKVDELSLKVVNKVEK